MATFTLEIITVMEILLSTTITLLTMNESAYIGAG